MHYSKHQLLNLEGIQSTLGVHTIESNLGRGMIECWNFNVFMGSNSYLKRREEKICYDWES